MGVLLHRGNETDHGRCEPPESRLQDAALGLAEAGQIESGELAEIAFERVDALLDGSGGGSER
jgi:hypothetical protein